jgi:mono/diheme cytochrome c family protein
MKIRFVTTRMAGFAALTLFAATTAPAAENPLGEREFQTRCAMCHGVAGRGDGWLSEHLLQRPPSLRQLKKNNGGVFPFASVNQVIDGRKAVKLHGPRGMPVWGTVYSVEQQMANEARSGVSSSDEQLVRAKIRALTNYLSQLQE